jgi:AcrR family transcriptional regulator
MGALYKHFSSREDLLEAVFEQRLNWRNQLLKGDSWADLRRALLAYRRDGDENPFWREFNGVADWNERLRDVRVRQGRVILAQLETLLQRYTEQGEIQPPFDVKRTAQLLSIIMDGSMVGVRTAPELRVESTELRAYLDFAVGAKACSQSERKTARLAR